MLAWIAWKAEIINPPKGISQLLTLANVLLVVTIHGLMAKKLIRTALLDQAKGPSSSASWISRWPISCLRDI